MAIILLFIFIIFFVFFFILPINIYISIQYEKPKDIKVFVNFSGFFSFKFEPIIRKINIKMFFPFLEFSAQTRTKKLSKKKRKAKKNKKWLDKGLIYFFSKMLKYINIKKLNFYCKIGFDNPAILAEIVGVLWGVLLFIYSFLDNYLCINKKNSKVYIEPDFLKNQTEVIFESIISVKVGNIIIAAVYYFLSNTFRKKREAKNYGKSSY